ncbi:hypothetical protein AB0G74_31670 [Streptomyces sp. NPDC020875]|uniref:hypothetical protein n=1 Tax=Streptomyces sp. NPDC020875 TaxID=3154898 RepID=UPI0033DA8E65
MTACTVETTATSTIVLPSTAARKGRGQPVRTPVSARLVLSADGAYAARLAGRDEALFPERWTLGGPEPYAVPLPAHQPEERDSEVLPLADGRVLIHRRVGGRRLFSLLYPTGPETGELPLGGVEPPPGVPGEVRLLPPTPCGTRAHVLVPGRTSTAVWQVADKGFGPELVAEVPGRCTGGVWLDRTGRLLALDQRRHDGGPVKAVAVDLERGGEVSPLLQIAPESDDRLLLAEPDSGLLVVRSNAPGDDRIGWGVLGSERPVRFPDCLRVPAAVVTPFAAQPGQVLRPEGCAVAFTVATRGAGWLGVWRPEGRRLYQRAAPAGWFPGAGRWDERGTLRLPYATAAVPCGTALLTPPAEPSPEPSTEPLEAVEPAEAVEAVGAVGQSETAEAAEAVEVAVEGTAEGVGSGSQESVAAEVPGGQLPVAVRPVPLQQAPLRGVGRAG